MFILYNYFYNKILKLYLYCTRLKLKLFVNRTRKQYLLPQKFLKNHIQPTT